MKYLNRYIDHSRQRLSNGNSQKIHEISIRCQPQHSFIQRRRIFSCSLLFSSLLHHKSHQNPVLFFCPVGTTDVTLAAFMFCKDYSFLFHIHINIFRAHLDIFLPEQFRHAPTIKAFSNIILIGKERNRRKRNGAERKGFYSKCTEYSIY